MVRNPDETTPKYVERMVRFFPRQIAILFEYGQARGVPVTFQAMAKATGISAAKLKKIHEGQPPPLLTLKAIAGYFGISLGYFDCETEAACREFLDRHDWQRLNLSGLSPESLQLLSQFVDHLRQLEQSGHAGNAEPERARRTRKAHADAPAGQGAQGARRMAQPDRKKKAGKVQQPG